MSARPRFDVSLVTPDGTVFEGDAEMLIVPGRGRRDRRAGTARAARRDPQGGRDARAPRRRPRSTSTRPARASSRCSTTARSRSSTHAVKATEIDREAAERMLEEAKAELERIEQRRVDRRPVGRRAAAHPRADAGRGRGRSLRHPPGARQAHRGVSAAEAGCYAFCSLESFEGSLATRIKNA